MDAEPNNAHRVSAGKTAILIVNGGEDASVNRWIRLCLERIAAYTVEVDYRIYVWNNRWADVDLETWLAAQPRLTLLSAAPYEKLNNAHRTPLQRLYHLARAEGAHYIVTMDSDAHPLRSGWLSRLLNALDSGAVLAGAWRDEMPESIRPYVHPSCLATTVDFVESHHLRFDFDTLRAEAVVDTLPHFTWAAEAEGLAVERLHRSNQRNFHYLIGGIYGDDIYHHAAVSRPRVIFRHDLHMGNDRSIQINKNKEQIERAGDLLFENYDAYLAWLRGQLVSTEFESQMEELSKRYLVNQTDQPTRADWSGQMLKRLRQSGLYGRLRQLWRGVKNGAPDPKRKAALVNLRQRPFTAADLYPLARGWTQRPPDYVGIGLPKSGTTWWHSLLLAHPQIAPNRLVITKSDKYNVLKTKDTSYFIHFQHHTLTQEQRDVYLQAFAAPPGAICGEFCTQYLGYPLCLEHLMETAPQTRILLILRNPIDRFISHLNHLNVRRLAKEFGNLNEEQRYNYQNFSLYTEAALHSLYSIGLERLFALFRREQILILQYEKMVFSPAAELMRSYGFLGVDERFQPENLTEVVNRHPYVIARPDNAERARLADYFGADVRRTLALCPELDPALWPDFTQSPNFVINPQSRN